MNLSSSGAASVDLGKLLDGFVSNALGCISFVVANPDSVNLTAVSLTFAY